ncbi:MAG: hypothetical protein RLY93_00295 [Sumerlaeia bacterium]
MARRSIKALALAGAATCLAATSAQAYDFSFGSDSVEVRPLSTLDLDIFVENVPEGVAGVNFTLRIEQADGALLDFANATSAIDPSLAGTFTYVFNEKLDRTGVSGGTITGNVIEFRGVIYSTSNNPISTFNASASQRVATVSIPTGSGTGDVAVELVSAIDNNTGLLGISDASGNSLNAQGETRPAGDTITVNVVAGAFPSVTDFEVNGAGTWTYNGILPAGNLPEGNAVPGAGLRILSKNRDLSFGTWDSGFTTDAFGQPPQGVIYYNTFEVSSSTSGGAVPPGRVRLNSADTFRGTGVLFQDSDPNNNIIVTPDGDGETYSVVSTVPAHVADSVGGRSGFDIAMDILQIGLGSANESITLARLTERVIDPAALGTFAPVYSADFSGSNTNGWNNTSVDAGGALPGATLTATADGLQVTSAGPADFSIGAFSYGFWDVLNIGTANSSKLYRVTMVVSADAVPAELPVVRLRFAAGNNDFVGDLSLNSTASDPADAPDADGESYQAFFVVPDGANGSPLDLGFDVYDLRGAGSVQNPSITLRSITVESVDKPTF